MLVLFPHSRCNCRCVMCDIWRANRDLRELSVSDIKPHLDGLRRLGVRWVVLSGGEPLMHSNLWRLCRHWVCTLSIDPKRLILLGRGDGGS